MALVALHRGLGGIVLIPQLPVAFLGAGAPTLREPGAAAAAAEIMTQLVAEIHIAVLAVGLLAAPIGAGIGGAVLFFHQNGITYLAQNLMGAIFRVHVFLGAVLCLAHGGSAVLAVILMGFGALDMPGFAGLGAWLYRVILLLIAVLADLTVGAVAIGLPDIVVLRGNVAIALSALDAGGRP